MRLRNLYEDNLSTIVFTFGRFNPPTIGHEILINQVKSVAGQYGADYIIFASQSQDKKKNPLTFAEKVFFMEKMFPGTNFNKDLSLKTPFQALEALGQKYDRAVLVVGSDRVPEFKSRMAPYVEEFGYKDLIVVSAGERDPDADGAEGMSASKARELAMSGDLEQFKKAIPGNDNLASMMYNKVRAGLGIVDKEPEMVEGSIGSAINFPGYNDKEDKKKNKNKEKKKGIVDKIKSAVGLGESEMDKATLAYLQGIDTSSSLWKKSKKGKIQSDEIENMQFVLKSLGYNPGPIDGWFGNKTADAVRQFQKDNDLTVDGDPGKNTIGKMIDVVSVNVFGDPEDNDIEATYIDKDGNDTGIPATLGKPGGADYELDKLIHTAKTAIGERSLTKDEEKDKEKYVKGMKKNKKDFKKRYGDDAEAVMYATATKMAKESVNELKGDHDRMAIADAEFNKIVATLADAGIPLTKELNQWRREGGLVNVIKNLIPFINKKFDKMQSYDIDRYLKSADYNNKTQAEKKKLLPALLNIKKAQTIIPEITTQLRIIQKDLETAGITEKVQTALPKKIKPIKMPTPPQAPTGPDGTDNSGTRISTTKKGNRSVASGAGTYIFTPKGKLILYMSPKIGGLQQTHNIQKQTITVNFGTSVDQGDGDVNVKQKGTYDMQGNLINADNTNVASGGVELDLDKQKGATLNYRVSDKDTVSANSKTGVSVRQNDADGNIVSTKNVR